MDVRSEVTCVDFVLGADWSFDCPSYMKPETHFRTKIIWYSVLKSGVVLVFLQDLGSGDCGSHIDKRKYG